MYLIGGGTGDYTDSGTNYGRFNQEFEWLTQVWRSKNSYPLQAGGGTSAVLHNQLYLIGGAVHYASTTSDIHQKMFKYNHIVDTFINQTAPPNNFYWHTAFALKGRIHYSCGWAGATATMSCNIEMFNPQYDSWTQATPNLGSGNRRMGASGGAGFDTGYWSGGRDYNDQRVQTHQEYDPLLHTVTGKTAGGRARQNHKGGRSGSEIFRLCGASTHSNYDDTMDQWNIHTDTWFTGYAGGGVSGFDEHRMMGISTGDAYIADWGEIYYGHSLIISTASLNGSPTDVTKIHSFAYGSMTTLPSALIALQSVFSGTLQGVTIGGRKPPIIRKVGDELCNNPNAEEDLTGWGITGAGITVTRYADSTCPFGNYCLKIERTDPTTTTQAQFLKDLSPLEAGSRRFIAGCFVRTDHEQLLEFTLRGAADEDERAYQITERWKPIAVEVECEAATGSSGSNLSARFNPGILANAAGNTFSNTPIYVSNLWIREIYSQIQVEDVRDYREKFEKVVEADFELEFGKKKRFYKGFRYVATGEFTWPDLGLQGSMEDFLDETFIFTPHWDNFPTTFPCMLDQDHVRGTVDGVPFMDKLPFKIVGIDYIGNPAAELERLW
jgi:hypothetical protein